MGGPSVEMLPGSLVCGHPQGSVGNAASTSTLRAHRCLATTFSGMVQNPGRHISPGHRPFALAKHCRRQCLRRLQTATKKSSEAALLASLFGLPAVSFET